MTLLYATKHGLTAKPEGKNPLYNEDAMRWVNTIRSVENVFNQMWNDKKL